MTVRMMKKILEKYNDDDRIIIDFDNRFAATELNEVMYAFKHKRGCDKDFAPIVMLQTRSDYDVKNEITSFIDHYMNEYKENFDYNKAFEELKEIGYIPKDFEFDSDLYHKYSEFYSKGE